jgi:hypothetical protein
VQTDATALLRELARRFPIPEPRWHRHVDAMLACRRDLEQATRAIEADDAAARALDALVEQEALDVRAARPPAVAAALERLDRLPVPEGEHPFLDEIVPTLHAMRAALLAVAASPAATERFAAATAYRQPAPNANAP